MHQFLTEAGNHIWIRLSSVEAITEAPNAYPEPRYENDPIERTYINLKGGSSHMLSAKAEEVAKLVQDAN